MGNSPAGSYWTVRNWLKGLSMDELPKPIGDCLVAFDNDQVIGKSYNVRVNNKVKMSIVTSVCVAEVNPNGVLQKQDNLKPCTWERPLRDDETDLILNQQHPHNKPYDQTASTALTHVIEREIKQVLAQQNPTTNAVNGPSLSDHVDQAVVDNEEKMQFKFCSNCNFKNPKSKRNCENCKKKSEANSSAY